MIQIAFIRENREEVVQRLAKRGLDVNQMVDQILAADELRRKTQVQLDNLLAESNQWSKQVGELFKQGKKEEAEGLRAKSAAAKDQIKELETALADAEKAMEDLLVQLPNMPHASVPTGKSAEDTEVVLEWGNKPNLHEGAVPHWDIAEKYNLIDFELGVKITGAGFPVYLGKGARLQRALINFFLDEALKAGYNEVQPPIVVNEDSGFGTGQLPDKEGQMYYVNEDKVYLIPTAEVPITNIYRNVILKENDLPVRNVGYTPCFRREAGSYGKDVRGLNRLHQFDKVEIVHIAKPENSYEELEKMSLYVQGLLQKLELPYRVLRLCGGDMGFASALTYDMEVWSAAQQRWLEVSSVSNFESFQSNRLKCRFKPNEGKNELVHTLNGSALALPRIVASLLENHQDENGVRIPKALQPYTGFDRI
ncbi:MAG: serine--tRNA ligase [Bacteroidota bacterium]|nr:serine--tRNA ligase [Bacteroidota bacterium]MDX5430836.1 serine--tRNA ligase [Bacteroidota bacterium]MDX5469580.1 serine--tRNA ligase [Bacteroidota bacterium]